jgi:protein-S-isoprenylcysteine O-methyltransferase Ste14
MTITMQTGPSSPATPPIAGSFAARALTLCYGVVTYLIFLGTFLYAIGFVSQYTVPKTIDTGPTCALPTAVLINLALMSIFAVQHSGMARQGFKKLFTRFASPAIERSTYVLLASSALIMLLWQWQPISTVIWRIDMPVPAAALTILSLVGWSIVFASTFMINHFELFGLHQVIGNLFGRGLPAQQFRTPALYALVRHPIYMGFIIAFWAAPVMTLGHLVFALVTTAYIFVGIALEERDLIAQYGEDYRRYRRRVGMLIPFRRLPKETPRTEPRSAV